MPPQSPGMRRRVRVVIGRAADKGAGVVVRREVDLIRVGPLDNWSALPWFCTYSEAFCNLSVEPPAGRPGSYHNGTEALPLLMVVFDAGGGLQDVAGDADHARYSDFAGAGPVRRPSRPARCTANSDAA